MNYVAKGWRSYRVENSKIGPELMSNFTARITKETRYIGGTGTSTTLEVVGEMPPAETAKDQETPVELPAVTLTTEQFQSMNWVMAAWGVKAVIYPVSGAKADLMTMIQQQSTPEIETVYRQTGWMTVGKQQVYLHSGGAIGASGNDPSVTVQLPPELNLYNLETKLDAGQCVLASLDTVKLCDPVVTWPLLAATLAPVYGPIDFAVHVTGRTGSFKSEMAALYQAHYGSGFTARNLPGNWSSTPNALEALAFLAANAVFVIDDFIPAGTASQQKSYQGNADKIFRAQGNQAGRARLTDTITLQKTMYPRGIILSTGEDTPEGHSVRARMLILELEQGMITSNNLTAAQRNVPFYCGTIAWLAESLAKTPANLTQRVKALQQKFQGQGHSRTPAMLGQLIATVEDFVQRAAGAKIISGQQAAAYAAAANAAIAGAGGRQIGYLIDQDPVAVFVQAIRQCLAQGTGFFKALNGGVPANPDQLGWVSEQVIGSVKTYKARGNQIGWVNWNKDEMYIDVLMGYPTVKKMAGTEVALSKQTLFKRLKEGGAITRVDPARSRNTVRIVAENHPRQVLCLSLAVTLNLEDMSGVESEEE